MADKKLLKYIEEMTDRGYPKEVILENLANSGYDLFEINKAFNETYTHKVDHVIHFSPVTIIVIIAAVAGLLGAGAFFYFAGNKPASQLLDVRLQAVNAAAEPGNEITYIRELDNKGSAGRFDVEIKTDLINADTYENIIANTETEAIETFRTTQARLQIPKDAAPGKYILRAVASYGDREAKASMQVTVLKKGEIAEQKPSCFDGVRNQNEEGTDCGGICRPCQGQANCNDNNPCTRDFLDNGKCSSEPVTPCCGNSRCESGEESSCRKDCPAAAPRDTADYSRLSVPQALDEIQKKAAYDSEGAFRDCDFFQTDNTRFNCYSKVAEISRKSAYCLKITDGRARDECYSGLANAKSDSSICRDILDRSRRDSCLMGFALKGKDFSVCVSIEDKKLKDTCEVMRRSAR